MLVGLRSELEVVVTSHWCEVVWRVHRDHCSQPHVHRILVFHVEVGYLADSYLERKICNQSSLEPYTREARDRPKSQSSQERWASSCTRKFNIYRLARSAVRAMGESLPVQPIPEDPRPVEE